MAFSSFGTGRVLIRHENGQNGPYFRVVLVLFCKTGQNAKRNRKVLTEVDEKEQSVVILSSSDNLGFPALKNRPESPESDELAVFLTKPSRTFLILLAFSDFLQRVPK